MHEGGSGLPSVTTPTSALAGGGADNIDTSMDISDVIFPNDTDDIKLFKGDKGDGTSAESRGIPSNVSFHPDGTSSPQQKRFLKTNNINISLTYILQLNASHCY